jgi:7-cyano-7-deazaguanine synthase in queuosine biosynthesis
MIVTTSQRDVKIEVPAGLTKVGIKMGGGADSSLMAYMIAKYKKEERPELVLVPIVTDIENREFQIEYTSRIINFIEQSLNISFEPRCISMLSTQETKTLVENTFVSSLYTDGIIECHFLGVNQIPPLDEFAGFFDNDPVGRQVLTEKPEIKYQDNNMISIRPFFNISKQTIKELYDHYNLTDVLFPMTKSCITNGQIDKPHCGYCWFCRERQWGFGKL